MANSRLDNQGNFWEFPPTCNMEAVGSFNPHFAGCYNRDRGDIIDGDYHWPGFTFGGQFSRKPYFCSPSNQKEPDPERKTTAGGPESKTSDNLNDPRTEPFLQAPPFFENPNPWTRAYGEYQNCGGRGLRTDPRNQHGIGPMNWSGPWGNFGPSMNFRPWGGFGPWSNFGHWSGLPFWGNPRFAGGFGPPNSMGSWGKFGPMDSFGQDENVAKDETEPEFNVFETPTNYVVCVSLFGVNKAGLKADLDLRKCELSIKGTTHRCGEISFVKGLRQNEDGQFEHKLFLGNRVNRSQIQVNGITARKEEGILIVSIPKLISEHAEIKRVPIE